MTQESTKKGYLFSITHYEDDPDRVAVPLVLANNALAMGEEVLIWLTLEAVQLAAKNSTKELQPKSFPAINELLANFRNGGGKIGVCPPCAKTHGVTDETLVENATWMGAAAVLDIGQTRQTAWF